MTLPHYHRLIDQKRILLFLNGDPLPEHRLNTLVNEADFLIAVDGAWNDLNSSGIKVDLISGDLDSAENIPPDTETLLLPNQNAGDLEKTLDWLNGFSPAQITVCGFRGGRPDHEWVNLSVLFKYSTHVPLTLMGEDYRVVRLAQGNYILPTKNGTLFSLICMRPARITLSGSEFPLNDEWLMPGSCGLSNHGTRDELTLTVSDGEVILFLYE